MKTHIVRIFILLVAFNLDQAERKNRIVPSVLHVYMSVGFVCAGKGSALCLDLRGKPHGHACACVCAHQECVLGVATG